jgi:hypothetical protein
MKSIKLAIFIPLFAATYTFAADSPKLSTAQNSVLEDARGYALQYAHQLPNFICTQIAHRNSLKSNHSFNVYAGGSAMIEPDSHQIVEEQLTFASGKADRTVLAVDGKKASTVNRAQPDETISWGEFGSFFSQVFDSESHTVFTWDHEIRVQGRPAWAFNYRVPKESGIPIIDKPTNTTFTASYSGKVVIDPESKRILEISAALELPDTFPIQKFKRKIVYADQDIAGKKYCLPVRSETYMETSTRVYDDQIDSKNYHDFTSESTIHVGKEAPQ